MKKLMSSCILLFIVFLLNANDLPAYRPAYAIATQTTNPTTFQEPGRITPTWNFAANPMTLLQSYYDYMIGGFNSLPMRLVPASQGSGYFLTYQGKRTSMGVRRVFYGYISNSNQIEASNELSPTQILEGYSSVDVDPISGKPIYAWHANTDGDTPYEIMSAYDAFLYGTPGLISDPVTVINNPISITDPNNVTTTNNEFIWPAVQIGPSPTAGMRRAYVMGRNSASGAVSLSENVYIAYTDFNADVLENVMTLIWNYVSVPELNLWHNDNTVNRRPNLSMCVSNDGKVYLVGNHSTTSNFENDLDVFVNTNFGVGAWQHHTSSSRMITGNPPTNFGNGPGYFIDQQGIPYANNEIFWQLNSNHNNATIDDNGIIHMIGLWNLANIDNSPYVFYNVMKEMTFNTDNNTFGLREIYPKAGLSNDEFVWKPWDWDGNNVVDSYDEDGYPNLKSDWNYPYWDNNAMDGSMRYYYNNQKITEANASGQMAAVWQNSYRSRLYNEYPELFPEYAPYESVSEIYISISSNYGQEWSDPIIINSVDVPSFSSNHPMWVYPADKIQSTGSNAKLGLLYYADNSWGSYAITPSVGVNDGGSVKYTALNIDFASTVPTGIQGTITRSDTNQPVPNVTVSVGNASALTNSVGHYTLLLPAGNYAATATKVGFNSQTLNNINVAAYQLTTTDFSLSLAPTVSVAGTVTGEIPAVPVVGATVNLAGVLSYETFTDASGSFILTNVLANQNYQYTISKPNFQTATGNIVVGMGNFTLGTIHLSELQLPPLNVTAQIAAGNNSVTVSWFSPFGGSASSNGLLSDPRRAGARDRALSGYRVWRLTPGQEANESLWVMICSNTQDILTCDDNAWGTLQPGSYRYAVKAQYSGTYWSSAVFSNNVYRVTNGTISGITRNVAFEPVDDAIVVLTAVPPNVHGPYTATSNATGNYTIPEVWYGNYNLVCNRSFYQSYGPVAVTISGGQILAQDIILADVLDMPGSLDTQINPENTIATVTWEAPGVDATRSLLGYKVWRLLSEQEATPEQWTLLTPNYITPWFYVDEAWAALTSGSYKYAVKAIYSGFMESASAFTEAVDKVVANHPDGVITARIPSLSCYPNPFGTSTTIALKLPKADIVKLKIYNAKGAIVKTLYSGYQPSGSRNLNWDGKDDQGKTCSGGLYLCRLTTGKHSMQMKLILMP